MDQQKKKRGENWSSEEKEILRHLIAKSANIIEHKSTKTSVNVQKIKEWKNISIKFNEITGKSRSDGELKLAWKRMKLSAKANLFTHRRELLKTGGGAKPPSPSPQDLEIMAIATHDFAIEENDYDSDAVCPVTKISQEIFADPKPGPSSQTILLNKENPENIIVEVQAISNETVTNTESETTTITSNERNAAKKRKNRLQNRSDDKRQSIIQSNADFKKRQLQMMKIEHQYNIKIAKLKIKKLELEIALLESKKNTSTEG